MLVRLSQQLDLTVCETKTLGEDPLDGHVAVVKHATAGRGVSGVGCGNARRTLGLRDSFHLTQRLPRRPHSPGGPDQPPSGPAAITSLCGELFHLVTAMTPLCPWSRRELAREVVKAQGSPGHSPVHNCALGSVAQDVLRTE